MNGAGLSRFWRFLAIALIVLLSSYCSRREEGQQVTGLSSEEAYLVETYSTIAAAWERHLVSPLLAESLFSVLDSTIDTRRIANTIDALDRDPERWILIFREINNALQMSSEGLQLEETR